jgi:hypothetical protein
METKSEKPNLGQCKLYCPESDIYPLMKWYVETEGMSVLAAAKQVEKDSAGGIRVGKARGIYQRRTQAKPKKLHERATGDQTQLTQLKCTDPNHFCPHKEWKKLTIQAGNKQRVLSLPCQSAINAVVGVCIRNGIAIVKLW